MGGNGGGTVRGVQFGRGWLRRQRPGINASLCAAALLRRRWGGNTGRDQVTTTPGSKCGTRLGAGQTAEGSRSRFRENFRPRRGIEAAPQLGSPYSFRTLYDEVELKEHDREEERMAATFNLVSKFK